MPWTCILVALGHLLWPLDCILECLGFSWWYSVPLGLAWYPRRYQMGLTRGREHCFAGGWGARLEGHGIQDPSKGYAKMGILSCTSSAIRQQPSTWKLIPVARRMWSIDLKRRLDWWPVTVDFDSDWRPAKFLRSLVARKGTADIYIYIYIIYIYTLYIYIVVCCKPIKYTPSCRLDSSHTNLENEGTRPSLWRWDIL